MTGLATTAPASSFAENLGYLDIPFRDRARRLHLYGGNEADSIRDRLGGAPQIVTTGAGGIRYGANYVDHGRLSTFKPAANSEPRNTTRLYVGVFPFIEQVYDADNQYRFPPTVAVSREMSKANRGYPVSWNGTDNNLGSVGGNIACSVENGVTFAGVTYQMPLPAMGYRDGTYSMPLFCAVVGHGPSGPGGAYFHYQSGGGFTEQRNTGAYPNAAPAASVTQIGNPNTNEVAASHHISMAYLEYSYLTEAEARIARAALCGIVEARGFKNFSHTAADARLG